MARPPVRAQELADVLGDQIRSGELAANSWLPAERQLAEDHGVGRSTVRQATQILHEQGLVDLVAGSGTRVRSASSGATGGADLLGEVAMVRQLLREADARLTAIELRLSRSDGGV